MNVVITGSTKGIGLGLAEEFLKRGHKVLINGRNVQTAEDVCNRFQQKYGPESCITFPCDISDFNSVRSMYEYAAERFSSVDIWINNAGMNQKRQKIHEYDIDGISTIIDTNLKGMIYGTRIACEKMLLKGGFIYNMEGFGSNDRMTDMMSYYGMTKRALTYFTLSAAKEMKDTEVKIGRLSPGMVITELLLSSLPEDKAERDRILKIYNILGDKVETVTPFLVKKILQNRKNNASISWLTGAKVFRRFAAQLFRKRKII